MVEIKDIRDELEILEMVLTDQRQPLGKFAKIITGKSKSIKRVDTGNEESYSWNTVLENHLYRVQKMMKRADKTYEAVRVPESFHISF